MIKTKLLLGLLSLLYLTGCHRNANETWEDTKTAGRYMGRSFKALAGLGRKGDSRQLQNAEDFIGPGRAGNHDFVSLPDEDRSHQLSLDEHAPAANVTPGERGSGLPSIDGFYAPGSAELAEIFRNVHFNTDDYTIRGEENRIVLQNVADYLIAHPHLFLFVEGHCDERGAAAYNLALGTRRANSIRAYLVQQGVNLNRLFTISYGKERPFVLGSGEEVWQQNRRGQFKLYER